MSCIVTALSSACDLENLAAETFDPIIRAGQRQWDEYLRAMLLQGWCKPAEPMAARLSESGNPQAPAHFITTSPRETTHMQARLARQMAQVIKPTMLIMDGTDVLTDGDALACVTRQYAGTTGRVTNCQADISSHLASDNASATADWRLLVPGSWHPALRVRPAKVARQASYGISEQIDHIVKWQSTLDMVNKLMSLGIDVLLPDAGYGGAPAHRLLLEDSGGSDAVRTPITSTTQSEPSRAHTSSCGGRGPRLRQHVCRKQAGPGGETASHHSR